MLTDDAGVEHQMMLAQLNDEQAVIEYGGRRHRVSIADMSRYWFGDYLLLWRPKIAGAKPLSAGMRGDEVRWLRQSLEQVRGVQPAASTPDVYDDGLVRLVEDFQRNHRLTVDGIAGMQTQMVLDTALGTPGTPVLTASGGQGS
jgi:general secretion pathway protein A